MDKYVLFPHAMPAILPVLVVVMITGLHCITFCDSSALVVHFKLEDVGVASLLFNLGNSLSNMMDNLCRVFLPLPFPPILPSH